MAASFATPPAPVAVSPVNYASATVSLLEIQRRERDAQLQAEYKPPPMTILQIQEQEREREEARQVEAEFERWWKEEQARLNGGTPSTPGTGNKRNKKKLVTGTTSGQHEKKDGDENKKPSSGKRSDQSQQKSESKKQQTRLVPQVSNGEQQNSGNKKDPAQHRPRKPHNSGTGRTTPLAAKVPQNGRVNTPLKQETANRNDIANNTNRPPKSSDHRLEQQKVPPMPAGGITSAVVPTLGASKINVAAPAFVPQQTPAFNPRAAAFVPPSFANKS